MTTGIPLRAAINALQLRAELGSRQWLPAMPWGDQGWALRSRYGDGVVVVSVQVLDDRTQWIHASMSRAGRCPSYEDLRDLHRAAFGPRWAYQVFAPPAHHINDHDFVLHLWGRLDGRPALPDFTENGTI